MDFILESHVGRGKSADMATTTLPALFREQQCEVGDFAMSSDRSPACIRRKYQYRHPLKPNLQLGLLHKKGSCYYLQCGWWQNI
jgi:hypothetical protein